MLNAPPLPPCPSKEVQMLMLMKDNNMQVEYNPPDQTPSIPSMDCGQKSTSSIQVDEKPVNLQHLLRQNIISGS